MRHVGLVLAVALFAVAAPGTARPDPQTDRALRALQQSDSLKVRSQAALILGQLKAPEALPVLRKAASSDPAPAVRIAAVTALARYGDPESRALLQQLQRSDPDSGVRTSAAGALAAFEPPAPHALNRGEVVLEDTVGDAGRPSDKAALHDALGRRLAEAGFRMGAGSGIRLKPSIVRLDVERASEKTVIAVRAELVAVEGGGRMAAMLEGAARLSAKGTLGERDVNTISIRALDAVAKILVEDLTAKLAER